MFYSESILSRRGALGKVWLAAHMERRLSKTQTLQTNIEQSVDVIMGQEIEMMALRLSGQLLLGVVRIYSRKAKYLLDDCNEALLKIKMTFRPGLVDLTEEQLAISKNAITLQSSNVDLDLLLPDITWGLEFEHRPPLAGYHQAQIEDITLRITDDLQHFGVDAFDVGPSDGIGSQDFHDVDLGIDWDNERRREDCDEVSISSSLGVGRKASHTASIGSLIEAGNSLVDAVSLLRSPSQSSGNYNPGSNLETDLPIFEKVDLAEFGVGFEEQCLANEHNDFIHASSPLTELIATPPPTVLETDLTNITEDYQARRKRTKRQQIVDPITELQSDRSKLSHGGYGITLFDEKSSARRAEQQFLRKSAIALRLLEIHANPVGYLVHKKNKSRELYHCVAPSAIGPELKELFVRPLGRASNKRLSPSSELSSAKRQPLEAVEKLSEVDLERGREAVSPMISPRFGNDTLRRSVASEGQTLDAEQQGINMMEVDMENFDFGSDYTSLYRPRSKPPSHTESQLSTPLRIQLRVDSGYEASADATCPIAIFDTGAAYSLQNQAGDIDKESEAIADDRGYSRNTTKALDVIRNSVEGRKQLNFRALSEKATRHAAASFFFELLVLSTRDCMKLVQDSPFEDIVINPKHSLWVQLVGSVVAE
ncbi:hypothetical protein AX17_004827 [Amanita inopinata Kibby_2008]|nr:hypothetical protein AX17_004827 [Amanita inopinata Kibby_2008]